MQSEIIWVNAVNEVAKCTTYPVGWASETSPLLHHTSTVPYISLLVDGLDFSCIELEGLGAFTAKYQHISVAKLNTWDGLSAHELRIVDLQLGPFLTSYRSAIVTSISIAFEILAWTSVEHIDVYMAATNLSLAISTRHQIDPPIIHHDSRGVDGLSREWGYVKPGICLGVVALTCLSRRIPPCKTTEGQDEAITY